MQLVVFTVVRHRRSLANDSRQALASVLQGDRARAGNVVFCLAVTSKT
jgi:hypothetical protein